MKSPNPSWFVYIIEAENGFLYTGITKDLERRFSEHQEGPKAAKFFRRSPPKKIHYSKGGLNHSEALKLEAQIKKMCRWEKLNLK
jgi:putative endonuclease